MKGLLLKDWYMMKKYCRAHLFLAVLFIAISFAGNSNIFYIFYPCLLCGVIPINLLAYDERSRWIQYSATLPYSRKQFVSAKYLIGLLAQFTIITAMGIAQSIKMRMNGTFALNDFLLMMLMILMVSTLTSSLSLPFIFKLGVEKGRIIYFVTIGFISAVGFVVSGFIKGMWNEIIDLVVLLPLLAVIGFVMYVLSLYISVHFYKKREL